MFYGRATVNFFVGGGWWRVECAGSYFWTLNARGFQEGHFSEEVGAGIEGKGTDEWLWV